MTVANLQRLRKKLRRMRAEAVDREKDIERVHRKLRKQEYERARRLLAGCDAATEARMDATLGAYELAERMHKDKLRRTWDDIERAEAELVRATNAVREPHHARFAVPALPCSEAVGRRVDAMGPAKSSAPGVPLRRAFVPHFDRVEERVEPRRRRTGEP